MSGYGYGGGVVRMIMTMMIDVKLRNINCVNCFYEEMICSPSHGEPRLITTALNYKICMLTRYTHKVA